MQLGNVKASQLTVTWYQTSDEGDTKLFNQYGVMLVNPAKHPQVKRAAGQKFVDWVISPAGQSAIAAYKIGGEQLFFPNYKPGA